MDLLPYVHSWQRGVNARRDGSPGNSAKSKTPAEAGVLVKRSVRVLSGDGGG